jgi:hypothetical protein
MFDKLTKKDPRLHYEDNLDKIYQKTLTLWETGHYKKKFQKWAKSTNMRYVWNEFSRKTKGLKYLKSLDPFFEITLNIHQPGFEPGFERWQRPVMTATLLM